MRLPLMPMPKDLRERRYLVSGYLRERRVKCVLDVGGERLFPWFLTGVRILCLNVDERGDCEHDGEGIPLKASTPVVIVCIGVLEYIAPSQRHAFVGVLLRVSKQHVVLAVPLGSPLHTELERDALELWRKHRGEDHLYLAGHVANGLPTLEELPFLLSNRSAEMSFVGSCREVYEFSWEGPEEGRACVQTLWYL